MNEKPKRARRGKLGAALSERELEVLNLIIEGLSNPEIAQKLNVSPITVKVHVHHIKLKRGINSRMKLIISELKERMRKRLMDPSLPVGKG